MRGTSTIERLSSTGFAESVGDLAVLLADAVDGGASLGFGLPFDRQTAAAWWRSQATAVADGRLVVWVARDGRGTMTGTVSLAPGQKTNGRHRGEVLKLIVHRTARGHGLARELLATAERAAAEAGISLLLLDTETGSPAEHLYLATGWTRFGIVAGYAADPAGSLRDCSFFVKHLAVAGSGGPHL